MEMQSVRGTHDLLPQECAKHLKIVDVARTLAQRSGFYEMATPIFEFAPVFNKTLGESSDIVSHETYTFKDRNGEELTLRPEGTAGIARAFISQGLAQNIPLKLFYQGPMFRYERPQRGRQRQFHQIGVELIGVASSYADVECIALGHQIIQALEIKDAVLEINSIGDKESRAQYRSNLVSYLTPLASQLSEDSQKRLKVNPLRILDSKDPKDQALLKNAPPVEASFNTASQDFFKQVTEGLKTLGIAFTINRHLVRGLDYYCHTVFEFKSSGLGAQDTILAGGRYDELIGSMGGPPTPGVGWAAGIERMALLSPLTMTWPKPVSIIPVHESVEGWAHMMAYILRNTGFSVDLAYSGNMSKRMKKANAAGAFAAVIIGPDEVAKGVFGLKNLVTGEQTTVTKEDLVKSLIDLVKKTNPV
jgi:histidyl-tRNA synthetase